MSKLHPDYLPRLRREEANQTVGADVRELSS